ncbi:serine hydrolase [Formosa sp. S-31]|uniref:serine hydrolase n=1 Tax=Formosa sp. S-31 TaxID=2790949 RepID=UPI003EBC9FCD
MKTVSHTLVVRIAILFCLLTACQPKLKNKDAFKAKIESQIDAVSGDVAIAFLNLKDTTDYLYIKADETFHAASTMKVPVMIELFKQQKAGTINIKDSIPLVNSFKSIVDGSTYKMNIKDDSDDIIYSQIGQKAAIKDLLYSMITVSSNLATNTLIERVDAKNVTATMRALGAENIQVLRGVEDQKAYDLGLSNTTTARDLLIIFKAIATEQAGSAADCQNMISILKGQQFNDIIPYELPEDVEVAHKTGSISGVHHDAGIVYLPNGQSYVLIILSKNLEDFDKGTEQLARISKTVYKHVSEF